MEWDSLLSRCINANIGFNGVLQMPTETNWARVSIGQISGTTQTDDMQPLCPGASLLNARGLITLMLTIQKFRAPLVHQISLRDIAKSALIFLC